VYEFIQLHLSCPTRPEVTLTFSFTKVITMYRYSVGLPLSLGFDNPRNTIGIRTLVDYSVCLKDHQHYHCVAIAKRATSMLPSRDASRVPPEGGSMLTCTFNRNGEQTFTPAEHQ
jgi:hypothetical protein